MIKRIEGGEAGRILGGIGEALSGVSNVGMQYQKLQQEKADAEQRKTYMNAQVQLMSRKTFWDEIAQYGELDSQSRKNLWASDKEQFYENAKRAGINLDRASFDQFILNLGESQSSAIKEVSSANNQLFNSLLPNNTLSEGQKKQAYLNAIEVYQRAIPTVPNKMKAALMADMQGVQREYQKYLQGQKEETAAKSVGFTGPEQIEPALKAAQIGKMQQETKDEKTKQVKEINKNVLGEINTFTQQNKELREQARTIRQINKTLQEPEISKLPLAVNGLRTQVVRLFEKGVLTDSDFNRYIPDPTLAAKAQRMFKLQLSGKPLEKDVEVLKAYADVLSRVVRKDIQEITTNWAKGRADLLGVADQDLFNRVNQAIGVNPMEPVPSTSAPQQTLNGSQILDFLNE